MDGAESAHRQPDDVSLVDPEPVQHRDRVVGGDGLRIGVEALRHVGRRIAAGRIGDAAVAPAEILQLRLPGRVVAAEFVDEQDRGAFARFLDVELDAVLGGDLHGW